jgi:hypothetical protein
MIFYVYYDVVVKMMRAPLSYYTITITNNKNLCNNNNNINNNNNNNKIIKYTVLSVSL